MLFPVWTAVKMISYVSHAVTFELFIGNGSKINLNNSQPLPYQLLDKTSDVNEQQTHNTNV